MNASPVDIKSQFAKLCPSSGAVSLEEKLDEVNGLLEAMQSLSRRRHWAYDMNRHTAIAELKDAISRAIVGEKRAA